MRRGPIPRALSAVRAVAALAAAVVHWAAAGGVADDFTIDSWETDQGLPEDSATSMVQTREGFLWFGTFNGLVRFDGINFQTFDPSTLPELPSPEIDNLFLERSGRLWISTHRGLVSRQGDAWTAYGPGSGWTGNIARTISEGGGVVCLTSFEGKIAEARNGRLTPLPDPAPGRSNGYCGHVDPSGRIWAANHFFVGHWDGAKWRDDRFEGVRPEEFTWGGQGRDGTQLLLFGRTLLRVREGAVISRVRLAEQPREVWRMDEDSDGLVWAASHTEGLSLVLPDGAVRRYTSANGLTSDSLRFMFEDLEHNHWVGSSGGGLMRLKRRRFVTVTPPSSTVDRNVKAVAEETPGVLLVGTYGNGLAEIRDGVMTTVLENGERVGRFIQCVLIDRRGGRWAGTLQKGLLAYRNGHWGTVRAPALAGATVNAVFEDSRGLIWIGGSTPASFFRPGGDILEGAEDPSAPGNIRFFAENPVDHTIWAGGSDGLFERREEQWRPVKAPDAKGFGDILCLHFEPDGTLWLGSRGRGLMRLRKGVWTSASTGAAPLGHDVGCILTDNAGFYWVASEAGATRVTRADLDQIVAGNGGSVHRPTFNASDGLPTMKYAQGFQSTAVKAADGRLWFATLKGVSGVDPADLKINETAPRVSISQVRVDDLKGVQYSLPFSATEPAVVPPGVREVAIFFFGSSYAAPEKMRFAYRIDDLQDDWVDIGNRRSVYFYPPGPGVYRFRVKAANNDGVWNETGGSAAFRVKPHVWQTQWFRGGVLTVLIGGTGLTAWTISRHLLRGKMERLKHQLQLQQERARLASVLEATSDLVGFADAGGRPLFLNRAGRSLLGIGEHEDLAGLSPSDHLAPWSLNLVRGVGLPTALGSGSWSGEVAGVHRDGREIPFLQVLVAHRQANGSIDFISTIARDITDRKRREEETAQLLSEADTARRVLTQALVEQRQIQEALRLSEQRIRSSMQHSPIGFAVSAPDGKWLEVNPALCRIVGYSDVELRSRTFHSITHPDDIVGDLECRRQLTTGECDEILRQKRYIHKTGRTVWVELSASLVWNPDRTPRYFVTQIQDITARRAAEQEARNLHDRYRRHESALTTLTRNYARDPENLRSVLREIAEVVARTLESERVSIWTYNRDRSALHCAELFQRTGARHSEGAILHRAAHPDCFAAIDRFEVIAVRDIGGDPRTRSPALEYLAPAGVVSALAAPLHTGDAAAGLLCCEHVGEPRAWAADEQTFAVAVANLLSALFSQLEQLRLANELRQSQKLEALGALAGGIAHDFNNMLAAIIQFTELTGMENPGNASLQENVDEVLKASRRAAALVKKILTFSSRQRLELKPVRLAPVVADALNLLRSTTPATLEIHERLGEGADLVLGDADEIHRVVMNLGVNATHAMRGGPGRLDVSLEGFDLSPGAPPPHPELPPGRYLRLGVSDTGHGMDEAVRQRIFDPFFTTKTPAEGTGLGLSVAHGIVKEHGGAITVESRVGEGTTFSIYLPRLEAAPAAADRPPPEAPRGRGQAILVIDDERALCRAAERMLTRLGYSPKTVCDPEHAWRVVSADPERYAAVITDLTMPGMTGLELAERLRALRPSLPVIVASGFIAAHSEASIRDSGVVRLVRKPLDYASLAAVVAEALNGDSGGR